MDEPSPVTFLADPLSRITRAERRNLLIASTVGLLVGATGLVPTEISTFGVKFEALEQIWLVRLALAAVVYFGLAFVLYGAPDVIVWWKTYVDYRERVARAGRAWTREDQYEHDEIRSEVAGMDWPYRWSAPAAFLRIAFEFTVPIVFALVAGASLLNRLDALAIASLVDAVGAP